VPSIAGSRGGVGVVGTPGDRVAALGRLPAVEARGDHRHPHLVAEPVVDDRAEDDVRVLVCGLGHQLRGLVDLEQAEVRAARDGQQHAARAVDRGLEQRRGDRHLGRGGGPVLPARRADAHERGARLGHDRLDVGEVQVDQAGRGDQVRDALHAAQQHLVRGLEGVEHGGAGCGDGQQPVVRDDDEGVDLLAQRGDALLGLGGAAAALEREGAGDHADGERAEGPGDPGDHGRAAGAGAAALAGGHEHHVRALDDLLDLLRVVLGGLLAHLGVGPGAQTARQFAADVQLDVGVAHQQRLRVGVDRDELDTLESDLDHPVDRVDAAAADAHDFDDGEVVLGCTHDSKASRAGELFAAPGASGVGAHGPDKDCIAPDGRQHHLDELDRRNDSRSDGAHPATNTPKLTPPQFR
jgi:hypothetical protein